MSLIIKESVFMETFTGLGIGFNLALAKKKEAELKQGKNDYLASLYQIQGLSSLTTLASIFFSQISSNPLRIGATVGNALLPFAGLVIMPTAAAVKQGRYEQGVRCIEELSPKLEGIIPKEINETGTKILSFIADNTNTITNAGLAVGTVALPFLGFNAFAIGIGAPLIYQQLELANLVPTGISIAVEKYLPTMINASMLLGGGPFSKAIALATASNSIPGASDYAQKKISKIFLKNMPGPSLEEIDAPWLERNDLTYDEINYILENHESNLYEINPAHCSKQSQLRENLPKDQNWKHFLALFQKINWIERYKTLKSAFRDDDRFIDVLNQKFPEIKEQYKEKTEQYFRDNFEDYIEKLAAEANISKEGFLASQLLEQMNALVLILCKDKAVTGNACDLEDAIESCSCILGYLLSKPDVSPGKNDIEIEDILIKLAIEGGDYCARGIKRAAAEIALGIIPQEPSDNANPQKNYELKIRQQLQLKRQQIIQNIYQKMIEIMVRLAKEGKGAGVSMSSETTDVHAVAIAQDVHTMDLYLQCLTLGFNPLTSNERSQFGLGNFATWSAYSPIRIQMYEQYQTHLDEIIHEQGELQFSNYIRNKIYELNLLPEHKETLVDILTDCRGGEKTLGSFHRLFLVMQGILRVKPLYADWIDISDQDYLTEDELNRELTEWEEKLSHIPKQNFLSEEKLKPEESLNQELVEWEMIDSN